MFTMKNYDTYFPSNASVHGEVCSNYTLIII